MRSIILTILLLVIFIVISLFFIGYIKIDSCLDHGGKWDETSSQCLQK